jgi:SAM-dependent methyltransferase
MSYHSEAAKFRELPQMKYVTGKILDIGCGPDRITEDAIGVDGRDLPGVGAITDDPYRLVGLVGKTELLCVNDYNTVFSSHFVEHLCDPWGALLEWIRLLKEGGHLVLYLPDGRYYNNKENEEHMQDMKYDDFLFWFRRSFCGEGKDFRGDHLPKMFELVDHGLDIGDDRYSFYVVARKV